MRWWTFAGLAWLVWPAAWEAGWWIGSNLGP